MNLAYKPGANDIKVNQHSKYPGQKSFTSELLSEHTDKHTSDRAL